MLRSAARSRLASLGLGFALLCAAPFASAGPVSTEPPTIHVSVDASATDYDYYAQQTGSLNPDGETYSMIGNGNGVGFDVAWDLDVNPDPVVAGSFTLTNLSGTTQSFILSLTLPSGAMLGPNVMGGYFGDVTFTDTNLDSSVSLSNTAPNAFYQALIDGGVVQSLGVFTLTASGGPGIFGSVSQEDFGAPIPSASAPPVTSSIGVRLNFTLSAGDRVQIPVLFQVEAVPEPSTLVLVGLGLAGLLALRRARLS